MIVALPWVRDLIHDYRTWFDAAMDTSRNGGTVDTAELQRQTAKPVAIIAGVQLAVGFVYTVGFLMWRQATPGKLACGLRVRLRFLRARAHSGDTVMVIENLRNIEERAQQLKLASMGRLSASIAHEIRNPLAAISYATQLLEESRDIPEADRRLLEIIYQQTLRMNGIVENVLGLARRERAQPEQVELAGFVQHFVEDYRTSHPLNDDHLDATAPGGKVAARASRRKRPRWRGCAPEAGSARREGRPGSLCRPTAPGGGG